MEPDFGQQTITNESSNIVSSAEFFVFTGVTAFLYAMFMGVVYVFFRQKYSNIVFFALIVSFNFLVLEKKFKIKRLTKKFNPFQKIRCEYFKAE